METACTRDDLNISLDELAFEEGKVLGRGAFGVVRGAILRGSTRVAVKYMDFGAGGAVDTSDVAAFHEELKLHAAQEHPNIVHAIGSVVDESTVPPTYAIVMERMAGSCFDRYVNRGAPKAGVEEKRRVLSQLAAGLSYLHSKGIMHLDIKSMNALLDDDGVAKLADFGLAKIKAAARRLTTSEVLPPAHSGAMGSLVWMARSFFSKKSLAESLMFMLLEY